MKIRKANKTDISVLNYSEFGITQTEGVSIVLYYQELDKKHGFISSMSRKGKKLLAG